MSPYLDFLDSSTRAGAIRTLASLARIEAGAEGGALIERTTTTRTAKSGTITTTVRERFTPPDWRADGWFLERRHPAEWSRRTELVVPDHDQAAAVDPLVGVRIRAALSCTVPPSSPTFDSMTTVGASGGSMKLGPGERPNISAVSAAPLAPRRLRWKGIPASSSKFAIGSSSSLSPLTSEYASCTWRQIPPTYLWYKSAEYGTPIGIRGNRQRWRTRIELANAIFEYLEIFHNRQRHHSSLGMRTPIEYETIHHNNQTAAPLSQVN